MSDTELASQRLARQGVGGDLGSIQSAVGHLVAVQAQTLAGAHLALRVRVPGASAAEVIAAIDRGELVLSWLNRATLHLVQRDDYWMLQRLTAPARLQNVGGRLRRIGISTAEAERWVARIATLVTTQPQSKAELRAALADGAEPLPNLTLTHLLEYGTALGELVRGPLQGSDATFTLASIWVGTAPAFDEPTALHQLAERYSAAHWPAEVSDFAAWLGIPLGKARAGWPEAAPASTRTTNFTGLLGQFDPVLHGWSDRRWLLGEHVNDVISSNGIFRPTIIVNNRAVGTWAFRAGRVELAPSIPLPEAIAADAARVETFLSTAPAS